MPTSTDKTADWLLLAIPLGTILAAVLPLPGPSLELGLTVAGAAIAVVAWALARVVLRRPGADAWHLVPAVVALAGIAVLREAGGGNASGFGPVAIVPAVWLALVATRTTVVAILPMVGLVYWAPLIIEGASARYPDSGWRLGVLVTAIAAMAALAVLGLRKMLDGQATRLRALALEDELTGLPNRRAWTRSMDAALAQAAREEEPVCLAVLDVDGFKNVNDTRGHAAGDELLVALTQTCRGALRRGDLLARLGGDEFGVLMPRTALDDAVAVLERLRAASAALAPTSIGVVEWDGAEDADEALRAADRCLYAAKADGGGRIASDRRRPASGNSA